MAWHTVRYDYIEEFKSRWPCHGLPDELHSLSAEFDANGDVVDIEAYTHGEDGTDIALEWRDFDGPALSALVQDCLEFGDASPSAAKTSPDIPRNLAL